MTLAEKQELLEVRLGVANSWFYLRMKPVFDKSEIAVALECAVILGV